MGTHSVGMYVPSAGGAIKKLIAQDIAFQMILVRLMGRRMVLTYRHHMANKVVEFFFFFGGEG